MSEPIALKTRSGESVHPVGIGTWRFGEYPLISLGTAAEIAAIEYALDLGQNHIDTAEMYASGGAELVVGQAIKSKKRQDLFIASKVWKNHVAAGTLKPAVEAMLKRLQTDYLDLLYIHAPWFDAPWRDAVSQIDSLISEGMVLNFGVSNFSATRLREVLSLARHGIAANQMHYSYSHQDEVSSELKELCQTNGIALVAYLPLEQGALLKDPKLIEMAEQRGVSAAEYALAWAIANHALPIPKASTKTHIKQNARAHLIKLTD